MKKLLFLILFIVVTAHVWSKESDYVLPKELTIALPKDGSVAMRWVAPPLAEDKVRKAALTDIKFRVAPDGAVWMAYDKNTMTNLLTGMDVNLAAPLSDFIWLDDGALLISSKKTLGFIPELKKDETPYQPICMVDIEGSSLASDGKKALFIYGRDGVTKGYAVYERIAGSGVWRKIFISKVRIAGVCVYGGKAYIAAGRMIYELSLNDKKARTVFAHPLDPLTGIAYSPDAGLFYVTGNGVGVVQNVAVEFIKCKGAQVAVKGNSLYLFLTDSLGVLRFDNIAGLTHPKPRG